MAGKIQAPAVPVDQRLIHFSFKYLDLQHHRFPLTTCSKDFFDSLFRAILRYQTFTVDAFTDINRDEHRHPIYFPSTREPDGFQTINPTQDEDLWTDSAWQFALPGQLDICTWRIHGFIDAEYFYVVWLDPDHQLD
jgi:hypothetical protein